MFKFKPSAIFFYHSDHTSAQLSTGLGSNEVISDETGAPGRFHFIYLFR